tara:strand:- start:583 stop:1485 length:903 start_codon:yes stop_codon:yes gene_type:complete
MRKILLASTALVALGSFSAHAADISISGGYNFIYTVDGENTTDETDTGAEGDVNIKFSNTTDSGITTTLNYGLHETGVGAGGQAYDDLNASMSSDFGTIYFDSAGDDTALGGFDAKSDKAGEGSQTGALQGIMGTNNLSIGYKLPAVMDGLTIAVSSSDTDDSGEYFGYGIGYNMGMLNASYVKEGTNTVEATYAGVSASFGEISLGVDSVDRDNGGAATADREAIGYGASYAMGDITLAYEMGSLDDGAGTDISDHSQIAASYAVAPGITAIITQSEVDVADAGGTDEDKLEIQLKLAF